MASRGRLSPNRNPFTHVWRSYIFNGDIKRKQQDGGSQNAKLKAYSKRQWVMSNWLRPLLTHSLERFCCKGCGRHAALSPRSPEDPPTRSKSPNFTNVDCACRMVHKEVLTVEVSERKRETQRYGLCSPERWELAEQHYANTWNSKMIMKYSRFESSSFLGNSWFWDILWVLPGLTFSGSRCPCLDNISNNAGHPMCMILHLSLSNYFTPQLPNQHSPCPRFPPFLHMKEANHRCDLPLFTSDPPDTRITTSIPAPRTLDAPPPPN